MPKPIEPKPDIQYRTAEVRALADGSEGFDGHASTWGVVDSYGTAMKAGAFKKTLKERGDRIPLLMQHDPWTPIGKPTELKEDKTGLSFKAEVVTGTQAGAEAMALLRGGVPLGMSFGFQTVKSRAYEEADESWLDWSQADTFYKSKEGREYVRVIEEVKLWEISLVTFPANESATISAVRHQLAHETLSTLLDSLQSGALDDAQTRQLEQLVAAWQARAGAGSDHSTPDPDMARRALASVFDFTFAGLALAGG